ncbi:MAG: Ig domain-containing protein [Acidobacteriia bacterium]|nr:Ig domain-containing protein [Terriglobia bacterium]
MKRLIVTLLLSGLTTLLTLGLSGCGGSSTPAITVALTSSSNGIDQAQTASITATVANDSKSAGVQWSVSGGGTLSGTTTASATYNAPASVASAFTATITATSITDPTKSASVQIKVSPLPTVSTTSVPAATAGTSYSATLVVSGGTRPYTWTITSGTLPAGLSLSSTTGIISGIPTGAGSATVTFQVADATGVTASSQAITITVNPPPPLTITTASLPGAALATAYSQTLQATGGVPSYTWTLTAGSLPAGLILSPAGVISGTPTGSTGTFDFTVKVTDSQTPTPATQAANLSITVSIAPLTITTSSLVGGSVGNVYSQTLQASGGVPPYAWSILGALPSGLTLNASTGVISGTPTATGTSTFTGKVTDSATTTATASLSITINTALTITTTSLPGGSVGTAYSATLQASGGATPYTWSLTSGTLPAGLSLNATSGTISGTPTTIATSNFTIAVTDSESPAAAVAAPFSITIASAGCPNNPTLSGHYAMLLNGWSDATTVTAAIGSFVADGGGNISSGSVDLNDQSNGPLSGTFTGTYCVASNNIATINLTYGGGLSGSNTFAAALNSGGSNGNIIFFDNTILKASGLLRKQDTSAFSTAKINGNYAFGFVGADGGGSAARFAMAGQFNSNGSGTLTGEFDSDIYLTGADNATLSSNNFSVASTGQSAGRGTATITFTGQNNLKFVFYVVSASEMLAMEDDLAGSSLVAGQVLLQTGSFTNASLNGVSVSEVETFSSGTTPSAAAGLVTTNGAGTIAWSTDQNQAGTMSSQSLSGSYGASANGRVTLTLSGQSNPPVFYLIAPNQAFVVGTYSLGVDFGLMQPQSGSNFSNSSLSGAYLGGSLQPVSASVGEDVDAAQLDGAGNFSRTSDNNGSGGTSTTTLTATYAVSPNGRVVVSKSGTQVGIMYAISNSQFAFLPASASDTQPTLSQFQH